MLSSAALESSCLLNRPQYPVQSPNLRELGFSICNYLKACSEKGFLANSFTISCSSHLDLAPFGRWLSSFVRTSRLRLKHLGTRRCNGFINLQKGDLCQVCDDNNSDIQRITYRHDLCNNKFIEITDLMSYVNYIHSIH